MLWPPLYNREVHRVRLTYRPVKYYCCPLLCRQKRSPTDEKQVLPMWCHGILMRCLTAHTRCIFVRCLHQLVLNQYAWHIVLRITLSLSSLTSCKRGRVPEITNMYTNIISGSHPHKHKRLSFHTSSIFPHLCKQCVNTFSHATLKKNHNFIWGYFLFNLIKCKLN